MVHGARKGQAISLRFLGFTLIVCLSRCLAMPTAPAAQFTPTVSVCTQPGLTQWLTLKPIGEIGLHYPPCYQPAGESDYPVLYLVPVFGGSDRDWLTLGAAQLADRMIQTGQVPPFLIVATGNTFQDFHAQFMIDTVVPYIESHTRASSARRMQAVAGGSLGGASAYYLVFEHPEMFASAGVFGNGLVPGKEDQIRTLLMAIPPDFKPRIFLNSGESDPFMLKQAEALLPLLQGAGIQATTIFGPGDHSYTYWISNFPVYFRWLASDFQSDEPKR
jgi:enterochelin esterase-like enzyme